MRKLLIISNNADLLKHALAFNLQQELENKSFEIVTAQNADSIKQFELIVTDNEKFKEVATHFVVPINLSDVINYIKNNILEPSYTKTPYIDIKSRTLKYMHYKLELTEQTCQILAALIDAPNMQLQIPNLLKLLNMHYLNNEALKTSVYRINQHFEKYKVPLKVVLNSHYILLEKL